MFSATISTQKICDYETHFIEFSKQKNKKLQEAIEIARKDYHVPRNLSSSFFIEQILKNLGTNDEITEKIEENNEVLEYNLKLLFISKESTK